MAGSQISKVYSKYWWNNKIEENSEFKIEFRTKESLFNEIENEIKELHDYDISEIFLIFLLFLNTLFRFFNFKFILSKMVLFSISKQLTISLLALLIKVFK